MPSYLAEVWRARYFWMALARMDLRTRYRGSVLGVAWSLLHPLAMTAILCVAFGSLFNVDLRVYAPFLLTGLTTWAYLVNSAVHGSHCFIQGEAYIRQRSLPLAIYPLRIVLGSAFHFVIALGLCVVLSAFCRGRFDLLTPIGLLPALPLLFLLGWSLATLAGVLTVHLRDTHHIVELLFQALFYLTPIIYQPQMLKARGLAWLLHVNPVVPFLDMLRLPVLEGVLPPLSTYALALGIVALSTTAAVALLARDEKRLIFQL